MKKTLLFLLTLILGISSTQSQDIDYNKSVGSTAGNFEVSLSGAATYQIPIYASPGTNGMQPNLSLAYNSQGGVGVMGRGWSITGLSAISRSPKTIYHDGKVEGLKFDATDHFALDGNLLVRIPGTNEFRTEVETFSKIVAGFLADNPYVFAVYTNDGKTLYYDANNTINGSKITWNISLIIDESGNYIRKSSKLL